MTASAPPRMQSSLRFSRRTGRSDRLKRQPGNEM